VTGEQFLAYCLPVSSLTNFAHVVFCVVTIFFTIALMAWFFVGAGRNASGTENINEILINQALREVR
jgi:hypothetical protein